MDIVDKNIGERLKIFRKQLHLTQAEMAERLGISQGYVSDIETGKSFFSGAKLISIISIFRLNLEWFLMGEGPMFIEQSREEVGRDRFGLYITPKRREIIELLQENQNPGDEDLILGYLRGKKTATVSLAGLQKSLDPSKT